MNLDTNTAVGHEEEADQWYKNYYKNKGDCRNHLIKNPGVLFQILAMQRAFIRTCTKIDLNFSKAKVLDVGSGTGSDISMLLNAGFAPHNITGVELLKDRVEEARAIYSNINFLYGDVSALSIKSEEYDVVFECTMFVALTDNNTRLKIAKTMQRVCKKGGYIMLLDWRTPKPFDPNYKALTRSELNFLFPPESGFKLYTTENGALIPPLGRFLSKYLPSIYFLISGIFPFLCGQIVYLLKKE